MNWNWLAKSILTKEPNSKHHVQQPSANRQPPIVAVPFEQSDLIAVGSNGYPSFQDLKNINPLKPCHILYSTTNAPLLTAHTTRERFMIATPPAECCNDKSWRYEWRWKIQNIKNEYSPFSVLIHSQSLRSFSLWCTCFCPCLLSFYFIGNSTHGYRW